MTTGKRQFSHLAEVGAAPAEPPIPPSHLKASGKRTWKRLWEAGQARPGLLDEPAVQLVCEHADQIADLRRMATLVKRPETELKYQYAIEAAERSLMSSLSQLGFTSGDLAGLGLTVSEAAQTGARPRRRGRRRTTESTRE